MPQPLRVLVVEDLPADAELVIRELERADFMPEWERVETEADYLARVERGPDVILADYTLPQFSAWRALELLKRSGLDIPLIVVSGSIKEEIAVESIRRGAADYILKDRMMRLGPAVKRALDEQGLRQEKRWVEGGLRASEARRAAIMESAIDCIIMMDHEGKIIEFNPAAESTFGYTRADVLGKEMAELIIPPSFRDKHRQGLAHYLAGGEGPVLGKRVEITALRANGTEFPVELSIARILGSDPPMFTGFVRDITSRKVGEEKIRHNLERIRALHDIDVAITSSLDLEGVLEVLQSTIPKFVPYVAASTVRLLDKTTGRLEPVSCWNLDKQEWIDNVNAGKAGLADLVLQAGKAIKILNIAAQPQKWPAEFARKQGLVSILGVPLPVKGQILGVLNFLTREEHDFSDEEVEFLSTLAGQAAIAIHNAQLFAEVIKSNRVKDDFLSVMSHELRTPLNVVTGYVGMIKDGLLGEINRQQEEALQKVTEQAKDQLAMINNVLYATVLEVQPPKVEAHEMSPGQFLDQLRSDYDARLHPEGLTLRWDYANNLPLIRTDGAKLRVILQNLIGNAIKFTGKGIVTISAGTIERGERGKWIEFKVADTGIGIPDDHLPFIFEKFRQVDSSQTRSHGGVGMGLYIVKQFAELLGGKVEVASDVGRGSTFTIKLPVD